MEEENDADYESASSFANPIERKKKKGLDFGRWKEVVNSDERKPQLRKKEAKIAATKKVVPVPGVEKEPEIEGESRNLAAACTSSTNGVVRSEREQDMLVSDGEQQTLIDEIEAENIARLSEMSTDEIAMAQAEITEKMDPELLEMLKKRARNKLGKKKGTGEQIEGSKRSKTGASIGDWTPSGEVSNKSWKAWSERVEKVRELRFALDGSVVDVGSDQLNCNKLDSNQYNGETVVERDFLRTEGDPAALGYTIKEAVALIRSMVPGQRVLALQLLVSIFNKAIYNMQEKDGGDSMRKINSIDKLIDWQAIWAFALGPEPQMALSLRIALDDNHDSVVLACAKAIQCILSCDINEKFFNITEKVPALLKYLCTAPVFRSKPEIDGGYLHGGFWKYNTKPSNILPFNDATVDDESEGERTIQDDVIVAGQDIAAGFIRMGILPRICYLLEMDPLTALEECLLSILIALARHSPTSARAIMRCPRLIQTTVKMCTRHETAESPVQIKAIILLKVLSQSDKQTCLDLVKRGVFQQAMWQWYRHALTLEHWVETGRDHCKLTSTLMVEQLRLWRVCIRYGFCIEYFSDFFPAMCLWLSLPTFEKLIENNVLAEFASVTREAYLVLEALAQRLPILHSVDQLNKQSMDTYVDTVEVWSWSHVIPMIDLAISWLALKNIPFVSSLVGGHKRSADALDSSATCMIWVISAVLHMLVSVLHRIAPVSIGGMNNSCTHVPWLPEFVPKVGLEIVRNGFLNFVGIGDAKHVEFPTDGASLANVLCCLRKQSEVGASLSSVSCLHGLVRLASSIDRSVQGARNVCYTQPPEVYSSGTAEKILEEGLCNWGKNDLMGILTIFLTAVSAEWHLVQSIEVFGRGGPAPGIGFGWGSANGGFWSTNVLLAQMDAQLILELFEFLPVMLEEELAFVEGLNSERSDAAMTLASGRVTSVLAVCLVAGPRDRGSLEKALDILLQAPVLKYLNFCIYLFLHGNKGCKSLKWQYKEGDYKFFSEVLKSHFRERWISVKKKASGKEDRGGDSHEISRKSNVLETIHEEQETSEVPVKYLDCSNWITEWARQRLPLPDHWFLSAVCSIGDMKSTSTCSSTDLCDAAKSGLFLLLGLESMSYLLSSDLQPSPISGVSLVWKLHALSMALRANMDVLLDEKCSDIFETLQELYGQHLEKLRCRDTRQQPNKNGEYLVSYFKLPEAQESGSVELLNFQTQVHGSYTTFVEELIEQFGAISYGDIRFGRQVALYLHQSVERPVRLAAWNALSNAHLLELLPPLEKCFAKPEGYLIPVEEDEGILEAYVKSWSSGALDRAGTRESIGFTLALHHISCFIFKPNASEKSSLQCKLARSLLRSYGQKPRQEGMLLNFLRYKLPSSQDPLYKTETGRRLDLLKEACEGSSSLLAVVDKLKPAV